MPNNRFNTNSLCFDPDLHTQAALAIQLTVQVGAQERELHQHRKGQLVMALHGAVLCELEHAIYLVAPGHAVWIPGGQIHRNRITDNARICFLFIEPGVACMPDHSCTLAISPVVRELSLHLANQDPDYSEHSLSARLVQVLLELLDKSPVEQMHLPISDDARLSVIVATWASQHGDRRTIEQWAQQLGMSARSLARLVVQETGLSFGRWRQQWQLMLAMHLLASGMAVQQVALELGYESVTAFITMFKKSLGQSPGRYMSSLQRA